MEQIMQIFKNIDIDKVMIALLVLIVCLALSRVLIRLCDRLLSRTRHIEKSLHSMLKTTLRIVLYFISVLFAAGVVGIPVTSFLALFSVVGLAVSLAVQGVLSNLAGGVIILASKPFALGDYIESDAVSGTVKEIGFLHTRMISPEGKMIFVPNNLLYNSKLINYTSAGKRRIDLNVTISYACTPDAVRRAAMSAVISTQNVLPDPEPQVLLENYTEIGVQYTIRVWTDPQNFLDTRYRLNENLYSAFREHGIEISYPHLNVHMQ